MQDSTYFVAASGMVNHAIIDGIFGDDEAWFTRSQIGKALEYADPQKSILIIHKRHKARMDKFSKMCKFYTQYGRQEGYVYNVRGVIEICKLSKQPKAETVMDDICEMAKKIVKEGHDTALTDETLRDRVQQRIKENGMVFECYIAPAIANSGIDIRYAANTIAFAAGFSDILCKPSAKITDFELDRERKMHLLKIWDEYPYKNHFTYDDIPDWAKDKIKAKGYGTERDRFPEIFQNLKRHDRTTGKSFCEINKTYHFTRNGYRKIIDYALKNHMLYPDEAERWKKEAGLYERNGVDA